jgi:hypothetical protein
MHIHALVRTGSKQASKLKGIWHLSPPGLNCKHTRLVPLAVPEANLLAPDLKGRVIEAKAKILESRRGIFGGSTETQTAGTAA